MLLPLPLPPLLLVASESPPLSLLYGLLSDPLLPVEDLSL
jgi:hypothetical protein